MIDFFAFLAYFEVTFDGATLSFSQIACIC